MNRHTKTRQTNDIKNMAAAFLLHNLVWASAGRIADMLAIYIMDAGH
jgi:hypothetical protein